ncbi:MerR family transcriptional regulator [Paenibacillus sp. NPDC056579]|uniref:MerR family transcriptional regulator n=1 Tax=unclassified Paenibacillus TaxID=185978 RepID=UPI001EF80EFC|nr:MerR family transcriptional regulator [Paenibacillus sp. H1-7]ULL14439.1 MerR family transcriptional regulator [Paenibacillus sp. H1-7]
MDVFSTKEVALKLGVSSTTVKRWVAFFHGWFQKDEFGHYIFSSGDISRLGSIKEQLQQGMTMQAIMDANGEGSKKEKASPPPPSAAATQELLHHITQLELKLAQKADDIVNLQVLQHRNELEDIRKTVQALASEVESIQRSLSRHSERTLASLRDTPKANKKKSFLSMLSNFI